MLAAQNRLRIEQKPFWTMARILLAEDDNQMRADVVMPGIDGVELAKRVAARQPGIRVMFITGFAAVALQDEGFKPKSPRVLAKPFHLRHLISEIEALLSQ